MGAAQDANVARPRFRRRIGFLLTGVGFAVGLGNIWRFPQLTSENGGAAFVFVYLAAMVLIGVPLLWAELALGQRAQNSPYQAIVRLAGTRWGPVGIIFLTVTFLVFGYYHILAGFVLRYLVASPTGSVFDDPAAFLADAVVGWDALVFGFLFLAITIGVVLLGVRRGLERANMVLMPALFALLVGLAVYAVLQPGAGRGLDFYLRFDPGEVNSRTIMRAINQVFFSIGIAFGFHLTIGSYMSRRRAMAGNAAFIAGADTLVAFVAGFVLFPLVFAHGLEGQIVGGEAGSTATLMLTMPSAFAQIGGILGRMLMFAFFLGLTFAALSSTIANLEVLTSHLVDTFGWTRRRSVLIAAEFAIIPGVFAAFSQRAFRFIDELLGLVLIVGGIALCLLYAFAVRDRVGLLLGGDADQPPGWRRRLALVTAVLVSIFIPLLLIGLLLWNLPGMVADLLAI